MLNGAALPSFMGPAKLHKELAGRAKDLQIPNPQQLEVDFRLLAFVQHESKGLDGKEGFKVFRSVGSAGGVLSS